MEGETNKDSQGADSTESLALKRAETISVEFARCVSEDMRGHVASLTLQEGESEQNTYDINASKKIHTVGRDKECDVCVPIQSMSRSHCQIEIVQSVEHHLNFKLKDTSTNGTFINNVGVYKDTILLRSGDIITFKGRDSQVVSYKFLECDERMVHGAAAEPSATSKLKAGTSRTETSTERKEDSEGIEPSAKRSKVESGCSRSDISGTVVSLGPSSTKSVDIPTTLEQCLTCSICQMLIWKAASAIPCMHSYCGGCISQWHLRSRQCPLCQARMKQVNKNHTLDALAEDFVQRHPEKGRAQEEKDALDEKNTIAYGSKLRRHHVDDEDDDDDDGEGDDDEDDDVDDDEDDEDADDDDAEDVEDIARIADIAEFCAFTGATAAIARQFLDGAARRHLHPLLQHAVSYYFDNRPPG